MSHLNLRKRSGKVVLERAEGVASCLRENVTSFAAGVQHLFSAPHETRTLLFFRPQKPIHTRWSAILGHPAFQAGCHEPSFHSSTPSLLLQLFPAIVPAMSDEFIVSGQDRARTSRPGRSDMLHLASK
jgi:hypothetical protein